MEKPYRIFAALSDESNEGWIWFKDPLFPTRTIVKVRNPETGHKIFSESRKIDTNFLIRYNERPHTVFLNNPGEALVISEWYRDALGAIKTTCHSKKPLDLDITSAKIPGWRSLRASCHHPDIAVRVGTRLGVLGTWLGLVGLVAAVLPRACPYVLSLIAVSVGSAILGILACWPVNHHSGS